MKRRPPLIDGVFYFMEIWKQVKDYEGLYEVSSFGNIKNTKTGRVLKLSLNTRGYYQVCLCKNGVVKTIKLHKLVAISFLNHIPCGHRLVIDHINNDKLDNRLENLQIITNRENLSKDKKGISIYTGVYWNKQRNKWRAQIQINGKRKHLGYFTCELKAHYTYKQALKLAL